MVKTELEEAGEDTEGMVTNTAKLQDKIMALTNIDGKGGIDILTSSGEFKSTYEILLEISKVWDKMNDTSQAALLELIAGKTRGSVIASIFQNGDILESAYESASGADGSAQKELNKYLDSIEGRVKEFKNEVQSMWTDTLDSEMIKGFVDLGTEIVKLVHNLGLVPSALAGVLFYFTAIKKNNPVSVFKDLSAKMYNLGVAKDQLGGITKMLGGTGAVSAMSKKQFNAGPINAYAMAVQNLTAKQQAAALASAGLTKAQIQEVMIKNHVAQANIDMAMSEAGVVTAKTQATTVSLQEALAQQGVNTANLQGAAAAFVNANSTKVLNVELLKEAVALGVITPEIAAQMMATHGLAGANITASASFKGLTASIQGLMASNPIGWIMMIISAVMMLVMWIGNLGEKIQENFDEAVTKVKEVSDSFQELKSSADTVIPRFAELAKGVDRFGKNISLTDDEYEEFLSLNNQIADMFPELNLGMDSNGNAMLSLSYTADTLAESLWELVEAERAAADQEIADNLPSIVDGINNEISAIREEERLLKDQMAEYTKAKEKMEEYASEETQNQYRTTYGKEWAKHLEQDFGSSIRDALALAFPNHGDILRELTEQFTNPQNGVVDWEGLFNSKEFNNIVSILERKINEIGPRIATKWKQINPVISAWMNTEFTYQQLDSDMQSIVKMMIGNIDFSALGLKTEDEIKQYVTDNILSKIYEMTPEVQDKLADLMNIDTDNISTKDYIKQIQDMSKAIADASYFSYDEILQNTGYGDIISKYESTAENILDILDNNIPKRYEEYTAGTMSHMAALHEYGVEVEALKEKIYSLSPDEVTHAFDIIKKYGIDTWDELAEALENKTFDVVLEYDEEKAGMEALLQAMEESLSATGLTSESITNLQKRYQDLEGYDPARLFEKTTNGIHLNAKALRELERAYQDQNMEDLENKLKGLKETYVELTDKIANTSDAAERANLYAQRDNIIDQINDTATLASQYAGLTSAYQKWQDIQSGGTERDMYEGILSGKEEVDEELSRGWADEGTRAYLELLSGQDLSTANIETLLTLYRQLDETINGAGYSVYDFFTKDEDGNATSQGIFNFLDTVKAAQEELQQSGKWAEKGFTKDWVTIDEDGNYSFDFTTSGGNEVIAETLGISEELVNILVKAAQDAGFDINMDSAYTELADFEDKAVEVNNRLNELVENDYTFNINSTDLEHVETQIEKAKAMLKEITNPDGTPNLEIGANEEDVKNAQILLASLIYQKQTLEKPVIISVDTTGAEEGSVESAIQKLIDFKAAYNDFEVKAAVGADTTEAETNLNTAIETLQQENPEILAKLGIDPSKTAEDINAAILAIQEQQLIDLEVSLKPNTAEGEDGGSTDGEVVWKNNIDAITAWAGEEGKADRTANGTVEWDNETLFNTDNPLTINVDDSQVDEAKTNISTIPETEETSHKLTGTGAQDVTNLKTDLGEIPEIEDTSYELVGTGQTTVQNIQTTWAEIEKDKETTYTVYENVVSDNTTPSIEESPDKNSTSDTSSVSANKHQLTLPGMVYSEKEYNKHELTLKPKANIEPEITLPTPEELLTRNGLSESEIGEFLSEYYSQDVEIDPLSIEASIEQNGVEGLKEINELQSAIIASSNDATIINEDTFKNILQNSEYTEEEIQLIIDKIKEYNDACTVIPNDPLGLNEVGFSIGSITSALDELGIQWSFLTDQLGNPIGINIESKDLVTALSEKGWTADQISAYLQTLSSTENGLGITIDGQVNMNKDQIDEAIAAAGQIPDTEDTQYTVSGTGESSLNNILTDWSNVPSSKTTDYTINETTYRQTVNTGGGGVNGTAHARGTAYKSGSWGAPRTESALVGELGPEMVVRNGRWFTVGENGAEFADIQRGDIIFNHKQTEDLLSKGYVIGRGKAYAEGTAFSSGKGPGRFTVASAVIGNNSSSKLNNAASKLDKAAGKVSKSSDEFEEVFDWIEVRLEEINEDLDLKNAKLENAIGSSKQNAIINDMIELNHKLYDNLIAGADEYYKYAEALLEKVPAEYREAAQDGTIAIEKFAGDADEKTLEAIEEYREWVQKGADATQQAEETLTEISSLAKQAIDNIAADYENRRSLRDNRLDQLDAYNALLETDVGFESAKIYQAMMNENNKIISVLNEQRDEMQSELDKRVGAGEIKKYSQDWYDAINDISALDAEIIELKTDIEDWQDSINELHWDKFDLLKTKIEAITDEAENLIDVLSNSDLVNKDTAEWTDAGITSLGLYAQQMEAAEVQAKQYEEEIKYLNKNWKVLGYTEAEYIDKLEELKSGQYDSIKLYHDMKDAIVDLTSERVDAIKEGIEREIDAYSELIEKKKEELSAEKDLYDFQKGVANQQKEIADIERKLAALSSDNSASARAQRAKLQAELAAAQQELQDTYYDRSISDQQDALDKELENFQKEKEEEIEGWEKYLEDTNRVVSDGLAVVKDNTNIIYQTLQDMGKEYSLSISESITSPWKEGESAIQSFAEKFGIAMSATVEELWEVENEFKDAMSKIEQSGESLVDTVNISSQTTQAATNGNNTSANSGDKPSTSNSDSSTYGKVSKTTGVLQMGSSGDAVKAIQYALNQLGYGNSGTSKVDGIFGSGTQSAVMAFQKAMGITADGIVGDNTRDKFKLKGYARGTTGVKKDQLALIDELGEELVMHADKNGKLRFMSKGSTVVPHDLTENLMQLGELNPQDVLDRNKPQITMSPSVVNNTMEISIDASVGELIHVENLNGNNPAEVAKIVDKAWDKYMKELNAHIRRYTNR